MTTRTKWLIGAGAFLAILAVWLFHGRYQTRYMAEGRYLVTDTLTGRVWYGHGSMLDPVGERESPSTGAERSLFDRIFGNRLAEDLEDANTMLTASREINQRSSDRIASLEGQLATALSDLQEARSALARRAARAATETATPPPAPKTLLEYVKEQAALPADAPVEFPGGPR